MRIAPLALSLAALVALPACAQQRAGARAAEPPVAGTIRVADDDAATPDLARVTADQAREAALARVAGATFVRTELEEEDGFLVYEVELRRAADEVDVLVDAGSGEVLRVEEDPDDRD